MSTILSNQLSETRRRSDKTLRLLDQGPAVAALHRELRVVELSLDETELRTQRFGASTRDAISVFQRQQGLKVTGIADTNVEV
jgi:peptidoglycan hydrolase-like protein with peptidoglycan-binding domain